MTRKPNGYWTKKNTISELQIVIDILGHFPTHAELNKMSKCGISNAMKKYGGSNYFRVKMGYEIIHKSDGYWTEDAVISELKLVVDELGYFPIQTKLNEIGKGGLTQAMKKYGSPNYFREKMRYNIIKKSKGYWTEDTIISELKIIVEKINHFPSNDELNMMGRRDLSGAITRHNGFYYFREKIGSNHTMKNKHKSELASYIIKRGLKSEQFVKNIITEWTEIHNKPKPNCNVKLSKGNVLEFVCNLDKKIGIDVTNTKASKSSAYTTIRHKWKHREYHLHLDELWIVVFTDVLTSYDYNKLNRKSPDNVKVFPIEEFLKELDYSTENLGKIDQLNECTFHNKEEIINLNRTVN